MPFFRVKSVKIYTGQKIYTNISVAFVTNMRYGQSDTWISRIVNQVKGAKKERRYGCTSEIPQTVK